MPFHPDTPDPELAAALDAELKKLPPVPAPASLAPRVLAVLAARATRPWWRRVWWEWPLAAKAAFVLLTLALAGAAGGGGVLLDASATEYSLGLTDKLGLFTPLWNMLLSLLNVAQVMWDNLGQPYLLYLAAAGAAAYLVCIGTGMLLVRATARPFQPHSK
jgi:hypothetical protein